MVDEGPERDLQEVPEAQLREVFGLNFFEAERLDHLVRVHLSPGSAFQPQRGGNPGLSANADIRTMHPRHNTCGGSAL